jgi:hypothetical protein
MGKKNVNTSSKEQLEDTENPTPPNTDMTDYNHSAIYIYNRETGKWEVRNPAGSIGYNYLYRDD